MAFVLDRKKKKTQWIHLDNSVICPSACSKTGGEQRQRLLVDLLWMLIVVFLMGLPKSTTEIDVTSNIKCIAFRDNRRSNTLATGFWSGAVWITDGFALRPEWPCIIIIHNMLCGCHFQPREELWQLLVCRKQANLLYVYIFISSESNVKKK